MSFSNDEIYRDCPWCQTKSLQMSMQAGTRKIATSKGGSREWTWLSCPRCAGVISVESHINASVVLKVVPEGNVDITVQHLPDDVKEYYTNAIIVLNTGVASATAVELRRTLEAAAKHKGVVAKNLVQAIQKLADDGWITNGFTDVLSRIRKVGNMGAHASDESVTEQEARQALMFTTQVLRNLFEIPYELGLLESTEKTNEPVS